MPGLILPPDLRRPLPHSHAEETLKLACGAYTRDNDVSMFALYLSMNFAATLFKAAWLLEGKACTVRMPLRVPAKLELG